MPARRQTLMFSATLPQVVKKLAADYLCYPAEIRIGTTGPPKELNHEVWPVRSDREKEQALRELLAQEHECVLVFCRTKLGAAQLARMLSRWGEKVAAIHGDRLQSERERALDAFRGGRIRILVGTDVASRGLDIEGIDLVLNYDTPRDAEDYVHRVGRTARAKRSGIAVTFVLPDEERYLKRIEQFIKAGVPRQAQAGAGAAAAVRGETKSQGVKAAGEEPRKRSSRGGRGRGGGPSASSADRRGASSAPVLSQPGAPAADEDSTYIEDDAYAPRTVFNGSVPPQTGLGKDAPPETGARASDPDGAPRKRRRGKRGGRGRGRGGNGAPTETSLPPS